MVKRPGLLLITNRAGKLKARVCYFIICQITEQLKDKLLLKLMCGTARYSIFRWRLLFSRRNILFVYKC